MGKVHWVIRWCSKTGIWLIASNGLIYDNCIGHARSKQNVAHPGKIRRWEVLNNRKQWMKDDRIITLAHNQTPVPPLGIRVYGRMGYNAKINGVYKRGDLLHNNRPYYMSQENDSNYVIRWIPKISAWGIDFQGLNNGTK
eukprot:UN32450